MISRLKLAALAFASLRGAGRPDSRFKVADDDPITDNSHRGQEAPLQVANYKWIHGRCGVCFPLLILHEVQKDSSVQRLAIAQGGIARVSSKWISELRNSERRSYFLL